MFKQRNKTQDFISANVSISPVTIDIATNELFTAGVKSVFYHNPVHNSNIPVNKQFMNNLFNKYHQWRGKAYTRYRAENHLRQFQTLGTCIIGLGAINKQPEHIVRLRDDAYIVNTEILQIFKTQQDALIPTIITSTCAAWGGINDKMAIVSGKVAKEYFISPLNLYHRDIDSFIVNPETYYMDTYRRVGIQLLSSNGISVVTSRFINNGRYLETTLRGVHPCEKQIIEKVDMGKCDSIQAFDTMVKRMTKYPIIDNTSGIFNRQNPMCSNSVYSFFHVVIPFYNLDGNTLRASLNSVINQKYVNYQLRIWLVDDNSTNAETHNELRRICFNRVVKTAEDYTKLQNLDEENVICLTKSIPAHLGPGGNKYFALKFIEKVASPNDVVVIVDGDDELLPGALQEINNKYINDNVWCTYGSYRGKFSYQTEDLPKLNVGEFFFPRKESNWRYGHPRTFKVHLLRHINEQDFRHMNEAEQDIIQKPGTWLQKATDRGYVYRMLELSGLSRIGYIDKQIYLYKFDASKSTLATVSQAVKKNDLDYIQNLQPSVQLQLPVHVILTLWKRLDVLGWQLESLQKNNIIGRRLHIHLLNNNAKMKNKVDSIVNIFVEKSNAVVIIVEDHTEECYAEFCISTSHNDVNWHAFSRFILVDKLLKVIPMDYVIFLDDDQIWQPTHISNLLNEYRPKSMTTWYGKLFANKHRGEPADYWTPDPSASMDKQPNIKRFKYGGPGGSIIDTNLWLFAPHILRLLNNMQRFYEFDDIWVSFVLDAMLGWEIRRTLTAFPYLLEREAHRRQGRIWSINPYFINGMAITDSDNPERSRLAKELTNVGTFAENKYKKKMMFNYLQKYYSWEVYTT